jgi:hypothetical protein
VGRDGKQKEILGVGYGKEEKTSAPGKKRKGRMTRSPQKGLEPYDEPVPFFR